MGAIEAPSNICIYASRYNGGSLAGAFWHRAGGHLITANGLATAPDFCSTTFCVGRAVFHAIKMPTMFSFDHIKVGQQLGLEVLWPSAMLPLRKPTGSFVDASVSGIVRTFWSLIGVPVSPDSIPSDTAWNTI
jgi:hypothetical protein